MDTLRLNLALLVAAALVAFATADIFTGDGTAFSPTVATWGGDLRRFNCQFNTTSSYFAANFAAMNHPQWEESATCGRCVSVWCIDPRCPVQNVKRVLQIVDHCGECQYGDIDMSYDAYRAVTGMHPHRLKVSWEWTECRPFLDQPNILLTPKSDGVNQYWQALNFANLAQPLKSVSINGQDLPRSGWNGWVWTPQGGGALNLKGPFTLRLSSNSGETLSTTISTLTQQWLSVQFSASNTGGPSNDSTTLPGTASPGPASPSTAPMQSPPAQTAPTSPSPQPPYPPASPSPSTTLNPAASSPPAILTPSAASPPSTSSPSASPCTDVPTPGFSCTQQKAWGKCQEVWMRGYCDRTCGRCSSDAAPEAQPAPSPPANQTAAASPAVAPSPPANHSAGPPPSGHTAEYAKVLGLSWLFYEAQRSGRLSASTNRVPWRGDSHTDDKVPGGLYDAGDHLKLNFPMATSAAFLAWGVLEFKDAYSKTDQLQHALDSLRWVADYLMACHISETEYIGQIGDPGQDHAYWGRPEEQTGPRPYFVWGASKPGSDLIGAAASALASISLVLKDSDAEYAGACLHHARQLYTLAAKHPGKYSDSFPSVTYVYMSANYLDDLAFAAAWLYKATGESQYLDAAQQHLKDAQYQRNPYVNWDAVFVAADNLLLSMGVKGSEAVNGDIEWQFNNFLKSWQQGQNGIKMSPKGLAIAPLGGWGNLRHSSSAAFMMLLHAKYTTDAGERSACIQWARKQIDYAMGSSGRSYVVGYGVNPPTQPHHRAASCANRPAPCDYNTAFNNPGPNPQVLYGALVGGPTDSDDYKDVRSDYQRNEVAVDYNAAFTGALAGLVQLLQAS